MIIKERVLVYLTQNKQGCARQIADDIGTARHNVTSVMTDLYRAKKVHVCAWSKSGCSIIKIYAAGLGIDAPKPKALTERDEIEKKLLRELIAQDRTPFDPRQPRCDIAASWIKTTSGKTPSKYIHTFTQS